MLHVLTLPIKDQIFTHIDEDTGRQIVFAVSAIRRKMDQLVYPLSMTPITYRDTVTIMKHRGIEKPRLVRAAQTKTYLPLLYLDMGDGTHLLVDGSHTYVARQMKGHKWALAYLVPFEVWHDYTVEGLEGLFKDEAELLASYSGVSI